MREIKATALKKNDVIALRYNFAEKIESWDFGVVYKISESQLVLWTDFRFNQKYKGHLVAKPLYFSILFLDGRAKIFLIGKLVKKDKRLTIVEPRKLRTKEIRRT